MLCQSSSLVMKNQLYWTDYLSPSIPLHAYRVWLYWSLVIMKTFHVPLTFHYNGLHWILRFIHNMPFAWQVPLVEQELLTILKYMSLTTVFTEVCVAQSLVFCVAFCKSLFVLFLLAILLSVLRYTASDYTFNHFSCTN